MTREIKFRVWTGKKMINWENLWNIEVKLPTKFGKNKFLGLLNVALLARGNQGLTALQFTGLKDKNGREIYEGDICQITWRNLNNNPITYNSEKRQVVFDNGEFCFYPRSSFHYFRAIPQNCEVVGNIFENPELTIQERTFKTIESSIANLSMSNLIDESELR